MVKRGGNCFNSTSAHWSYTENAISKSVLWIGLSYFSKNAWKRIAHAEFIWNFPVCTYFSVSIFRSLVDLGTALSKRSSVVIFDMFIFTPQLQSLHSCRISPCSLPDKKKKKQGWGQVLCNWLQKGEKNVMKLAAASEVAFFHSWQGNTRKSYKPGHVLPPSWPNPSPKHWCYLPWLLKWKAWCKWKLPAAWWHSGLGTLTQRVPLLCNQALVQELPHAFKQSE